MTKSYSLASGSMLQNVVGYVAYLRGIELCPKLLDSMEESAKSGLRPLTLEDVVELSCLAGESEGFWFTFEHQQCYNEPEDHLHDLMHWMVYPPTLLQWAHQLKGKLVRRQRGQAPYIPDIGLNPSPLVNDNGGLQLLTNLLLIQRGIEPPSFKSLRHNGFQHHDGGSSLATSPIPCAGTDQWGRAPLHQLLNNNFIDVQGGTVRFRPLVNIVLPTLESTESSLYTNHALILEQFGRIASELGIPGSSELLKGGAAISELLNPSGSNRLTQIFGSR